MTLSRGRRPRLAQVGGVKSGIDAFELILCGAQAVQVHVLRVGWVGCESRIWSIIVTCFLHFVQLYSINMYVDIISMQRSSFLNSTCISLSNDYI